MLATRLPFGKKRPARPDPTWIELDVHAPSGHTAGRPSSTGTGGDYVWSNQGGAYRTFQFGDGLQGDAIWWDFETATGGLFDFQLWYVTGFDCGLISIRLDGREIALVDMYTASDDLDVTRDVTGIPVGAGAHRLSFHAIGANASAYGQPGEWVPYFYYWTIQRILLRRTASLPALTARPRPSQFGGTLHQRIDIDPLFASGSTDWSSTVADYYTEGAHVAATRSGSVGATRYWHRDIAAGDWELEFIYSKATTYGIWAVTIDGREVGRIDAYGTAVGNTFRVRGTENTKSTLRATIPTSGRHEIRVTVVDYNPSASNVFANLRHITFRQLRAMPNTVQNLHPGVIAFDILWDHGNTNWGNYAVDGNYVHGVQRYGSSVSDEIHWYGDFPAGTYDVETIYATLTNRGVVAVELDDVTLGTIDTYAASGANIVRSTIAGVVVKTPGRHKVSLRIIGKNASSSAYVVLVSAIQFRKTSDSVHVYALTQIPVMTSNTAPLGVASASSELTGGGYEAYCAMNTSGGAGRGWLNNTGAAWIAYQFPTPVTVHTYSLRPWWFNVFPGRTPKTWTFEGWNGLTWDVLDTITNHNWLGDSTTVINFTVASPGSYALYRLNVSANGGDSYTGLGSIQMTV